MDFFLIMQLSQRNCDSCSIVYHSYRSLTKHIVSNSYTVHVLKRYTTRHDFPIAFKSNTSLILKFKVFLNYWQCYLNNVHAFYKVYENG